MSANSARPAVIGIGLAVIILLLALGAYWFKSTRPKPVITPPIAVVGVGVFVSRNQKTHKFVIQRIFPGSPAEQAGLTPGVVLNKVGKVLTESKNIKELSALLMGPVGSKVTLELIDTNGIESHVELMRDQFLNRSRKQ